METTLKAVACTL